MDVRALIVGALMTIGLGCGAGDDSTSSDGGSAAGTGAGGGAGASAAGTGQGGSSMGGGSVASGGAAGSRVGETGNAGGGVQIADASGDQTDAGGDRVDPLGHDSMEAKAEGAADELRVDASATDAASSYNPCPAKGTPCVIMPLGDSITQGFPNPPAAGYRAPLFHLAHTNQQSITFVGSLVDGPALVDGVAFPRAHEGHSGFNIDSTQGRMGVSQHFPAAITTYKPNIVLLMIGTNDVDTGETDIPVRLGMLVDTILNADPKVLVVVAQIVPQQTAVPDTLNTNVRAYNAAIPILVKARADAGKHVTMVDMYGAFVANPTFSTALLADRLHPTPAGYDLIAATWYAAIGPLLR